MSLLPIDFANYLKAQGLSKSSVRNYLADLGKFLTWWQSSISSSFEANNIKLEHLDAYQKFLNLNGVPETTIRRYVATLKQFIKWVNPDINILSSGKIPTQSSKESLASSVLLSVQTQHKDFANYLKLQGLSKGSLRNYLADLGKFVSWFELFKGEKFSSEKISLYQLGAYQNQLKLDGVPESTIKRYIATLKKFVNWVNPDIDFPTSPKPFETTPKLAPSLSSKWPKDFYSWLILTRRFTTSGKTFLVLAAFLGLISLPFLSKIYRAQIGQLADQDSDKSGGVTALDLPQGEVLATEIEKGVLDINVDVGINSNLTVAGESTFSGILNALGGINATNVDISERLTVGTADSFRVSASGAIEAATGITSSGIFGKRPDAQA